MALHRHGWASDRHLHVPQLALVSKQLRIETENSTATPSPPSSKTIQRQQRHPPRPTATMALFFTTFYLSASLIGIGNNARIALPNGLHPRHHHCHLVVTVINNYHRRLLHCRDRQFQSLFLLLMVVSRPSRSLVAPPRRQPGRHHHG